MRRERDLHLLFHCLSAINWAVVHCANFVSQKFYPCFQAPGLPCTASQASCSPSTCINHTWARHSDMGCGIPSRDLIHSTTALTPILLILKYNYTVWISVCLWVFVFSFTYSFNPYYTLYFETLVVLFICSVSAWNFSQI